MGFKRFTLIELMIVIAIISILMTLFMPSLGRAKASALQSQCASQLRQCSNALIMYADGYNGWTVTYGPDYTGWFCQSGIPENLDFKMKYDGSHPKSYRAITLCPASVDEMEWLGNIAYGAPFFRLSPNDYIDYNCEKVVNGVEQYVKLHNTPSAATYVILADSAYTKYDTRSTIEVGAQCLHFSRRDEGLASPINSAISERHNGLANIAYGDAHVDTSMDKSAILSNSMIGAYIDVSGYELTYIENEEGE